MCACVSPDLESNCWRFSVMETSFQTLNLRGGVFFSVAPVNR